MSSDDMDASQATHGHGDDVAPDTDQAPTGDDFPVLINTSKQALAEPHHGGFIFTLCKDHFMRKLMKFSVLWFSGHYQIVV